MDLVYGFLNIQQEKVALTDEEFETKRDLLGDREKVEDVD